MYSLGPPLIILRSGLCISIVPVMGYTWGLPPPKLLPTGVMHNVTITRNGFAQQQVMRGAWFYFLILEIQSLRSPAEPNQHPKDFARRPPALKTLEAPSLAPSASPPILAEARIP